MDYFALLKLAEVVRILYKSDWQWTEGREALMTPTPGKIFKQRGILCI